MFENVFFSQIADQMFVLLCLQCLSLAVFIVGGR